MNDKLKVWMALHGIEVRGPGQSHCEDPDFQFYQHWYVNIDAPNRNTRYLHKDGSIHDGTRNFGTGEYTGWFRTKEEAELAIEMFYFYLQTDDKCAKLL